MPVGQTSDHLSPLQAAHDPYFTQLVEVGEDLVGLPRTHVFSQLLAGKRVLHVGYADWPITDLQSNLHVALDSVCAQLDGLDPNDEAAAAIGPLVRGRLFTEWQQVSGSYDVVLVPEVIEHIGNLEDFLRAVDSVDFSAALLTVPDAFSCRDRHFDYNAASSTFVEVVHPDHNFWFTPYTFTNIIRKFTTWRIDGLWFFNGISLLMLASKVPAATS